MGFLFCPQNCPKRSAGCHIRCEDYRGRKAEYDRLKAANAKDLEARAYAADMNRIKKDRVAKRRHLKSR